MTSGFALLLVGVMGAGGRLELGAGSEAAVRWHVPPTANGDHRTIDLTLTPRGTLSLLGAPLSADVTYRPRFSVRSLGPHRTFENYHEGELRLRYQPRDVWRLEPYAVGAAGRTDLVTLNRITTDPTRTQTITTTSSIDLRSLRTGASLRVTPDTRTELVLSAEGAVSGGTGRSEALLPIERTATGTIQYGWNATRLDRVGFRLTATGSRVDDLDGRSVVGTGLLTWLHRPATDVELSMGAGAVGFFSSYPRPAPPGRVVSRNLRPAAELSLARNGGAGQVTASLSARLGATNDRFTGRAAQDAEGTALVRWPSTASLTLRARGTGSLSWPVGGQIRRGTVEAGSDFRLGPYASLSTSGYGTWQRSTNPIAPSLSEYGVVAGITLLASPISW